ncbi:ESPR-type extended signal peptide-containing protein [Pinirhizobacter soli]|uniref:ESPR-type extended signal peptide-containing protein n=1 Tax=Pinirhizobacter soli TaxID=2786953 RepID=UPI00202A0ED6|nr:ESPR-type extended signal peptide-containing protein [Pinirhizobacter soli]
MNTIYRIVWNVTLGKWVVASELAKGRKKKSSLKTAMLSLAVIGAMAGIGASSVYAADVTAPSSVVGEDPHETASNELVMTPFFVGGAADDKGNATNTAIGQGASAGISSTSDTKSTAVGSGAQATTFYATAVGGDSYAATQNSVAIGNGARAGIDTANVVAGLAQTAIGSGASATGASGATAIGWGAKATSVVKDEWSATAVGTHAVADGDGAAALGDSANATGDRTAAFGRGAKATQNDATAFGAGTSVVAAGGTAIGSGAQVAATASSAVAIGNGSSANRANTVSVGTTAAGGQRQVVNVAAGTQNTDAVNVSQLNSTAKSVADALGGSASVNPDGTVKAPSYTLADLANGGNKTVNNVGDALGQLNSNVTNVDARVTAATRYFKANGKNDGTDDASAAGANAIAIGSNAKALKTLSAGAIAIGNNAVAESGTSANLQSSIAMGVKAASYNAGAVAIGEDARAGVDKDGNKSNANFGVSIGTGTRSANGASAVGYLASAAGGSSVAFGIRADVGANASSGIALGNQSTVTAGDGRTANGSMALGNGAAVSTTGATGTGNADNSLAIGTGAKVTASSAQHANNSIAIGNGAKVTSSTTVEASNSIALGNGASATASNAVALGAGSTATTANTVSVGNATTQRKIINLAAGTADTDGVNVSQLKGTAQSVAGSLGGGSTVKADGTINRPSYTVADLGKGGNKTVDNVGDALGQLNANTTQLDGRVTKNEGDIVTIGDRVTKTEGDIVTVGKRVTKNEGDIVTIGDRVTSTETNITNLDGRVTTNEGDIVDIRKQLGSGSIGLVQQDATSRDITVAAGTDGGRVNFAGTDGARKLAGVAAGELSATSAEAVNGSQLFATNERVTKNEGDIVTIGDRVTKNEGDIVTIGSRVTKNEGDIVTIGDRVTSTETNVTNLDGRVTTNEGDIVDIRKQLGSGSIGLVQQDETSRDITVAAGTDGGRVNFAGTDGARKLAGVAAGELSATSAEAVNGSQLFATNERVTKSEGDIVNLDGRVTKNEGDIIDLGDRINNGSVGLVQQAGANASVTVAAASGGTVVDFTGTDGTRQLKGVSEGSDDTDAVNVGQLKKAGLVGGDGSTLDAVVYDAGSNRGSVTFGGLGGTKLTNVMAGLVSSTSTDAVNGSQLWILQDQVNQLGDSVTNMSINIQNNAAPGNGPAMPSPVPAPGNGEGGRDPAFAANGDGGPASATGKDSVAAGTGASATADNSVAIGAGSVADRADTVSVGSAGHERVVSNVAAGSQRTDAANWGQVQDALATANRYTDDRFDGVNRRIGEVQRQANRGIAASAALINVTPYMPGKTVLNAGVANYRGESALGVGVSRWNDTGRVNFNAGMSAAAGDSPIFRMGVGVVLGD